jgi:hypothetical protein
MSERPPVKPSRADVSDPSESLPVLVGRLGDDLRELIDSRLSLLKIELQEDLRWYARNGTRAIIGGVVASLGVGLLSTAAAFVVSTLLRAKAGVNFPAAYSLGFSIVGFLFLIGGAVVAVRAARSLTGGDPTAEQDAQSLESSERSLRGGHDSEDSVQDRSPW